jgi:hypothetical protein
MTLIKKLFNPIFRNYYKLILKMGSCISNILYEENPPLKPVKQHVDTPRPVRPKPKIMRQ